MFAHMSSQMLIFSWSENSDIDSRPSRCTDRPGHGHGERVLYVDDEEPLVALMTRMLTQLFTKYSRNAKRKKARKKTQRRLH